MDHHGNTQPVRLPEYLSAVARAGSAAVGQRVQLHCDEPQRPHAAIQLGLIRLRRQVWTRVCHPVKLTGMSVSQMSDRVVLRPDTHQVVTGSRLNDRYIHTALLVLAQQRCLRELPIEGMIPSEMAVDVNDHLLFLQ